MGNMHQRLSEPDSSVPKNTKSSTKDSQAGSIIWLCLTFIVSIQNLMYSEGESQIWKSEYKSLQTYDVIWSAQRDLV